MDICILASLGIILVLGCCWYIWSRRRGALDEAWEAQHPRAAFEYCGKTLRFYEDSHGNQVEYLDPAGHCYLWYPGNSDVVVGRWRRDETFIYFRYGNNSYNPVTGVIGGQWEQCPIVLWATSIVEAVPGDVLELECGLPFVLKSHPPIRSIRHLAATSRQ